MDTYGSFSGESAAFLDNQYGRTLDRRRSSALQTTYSPVGDDRTASIPPSPAGSGYGSGYGSGVMGQGQQAARVPEGYFREPDAYSYHSNTALLEDTYNLPEEEKCLHCGYELSICEICPVSGQMHPKPAGARPTQMDTRCTDCNGLAEESVKPHMHRQLLVAARMRQVQRELFGVATQPRGPGPSESEIWPRVQQLEQDKTFLISAARQLGIQVPAHQPPPRAPGGRPDIPAAVLEADALSRFNKGLRTLIEQAIAREEQHRAMAEGPPPHPHDPQHPQYPQHPQHPQHQY